MGQAWNARVPLEVIRFAAVNHLLMELTYKGTKRLVEPYSLFRTKDGNLLLRAIKHKTGEPRSYRLDRVQDVVVTQMPFKPRYAIEMNASGTGRSGLYVETEF